MKKYFFYSLAILFLLISCTQPKVDKIIAKHVIKINIDKSQVFDVSNLMKLWDYIPLETTGESIIKKIDKIYVTDSFILIFDSKLSEILLFNKKGKFIRKFGKKGQGPGEHIMFHDIFFEESTGLVYAEEAYKRSIFIYNMSGKLVNEISTNNFWFRSFIKVEKGYWIYSCYERGNPNIYNLMLVDNNFHKIIKGYLPQKKFFRTTIGTTFVQNDKKESFFIYPNSNIIYQIKDENIIPLYSIDFGVKTIPYSKIPYLNTESEYSKLVNENGYLGDIDNFHFSGNNFYFTFGEMKKQSKRYSACYDIDRAKVEVYNSYLEYKPLNYKKSTFKHITFIQPIGTFKDGLIYTLNPWDLMENDFLTLKNKSTIPIQVDSNPILFFLKNNVKQ